jgi:hypothetical protein
MGQIGSYNSPIKIDEENKMSVSGGVIDINVDVKSVASNYEIVNGDVWITVSASANTITIPKGISTKQVSIFMLDGVSSVSVLAGTGVSMTTTSLGGSFTNFTVRKVDLCRVGVDSWFATGY